MKYKMTLIFCIIAAVVLGAYLGEMCSDIEYLKFLGYSKSFGFDSTTFDIQVISLTLGFRVEMNVMQLLLLAISIFVARKLADAIKTS